MYYQCVTSVNS